MSVTPIKYVNIIGMAQKIDSVARVCVDSQCFHPDEVGAFYKVDHNFSPINYKNIYSETLEKMRTLLLDLDFELKPAKNCNSYSCENEELTVASTKIYDELYSYLNEKRRICEALFDCRHKAENSSHFLNLDFDLQKAMQTKFVTVNFGRLPISNFNKLSAYEDDPYVTFFPTDKDNDYYWGVYIAPVKSSHYVDRIFSGLFFESFDIGSFEGTPAEYHEKLVKHTPVLETQLADIEKKITLYKQQHGEKIIDCYSRLLKMNALYSVINTAQIYHNNFILVGWIPSDKIDEFKRELLNIESVEFSAIDGNEELEHKPPVKLKNPFFAKPFEMYTEMYGMPNYNEIDPTKFIAFTYSLLFGIMFADVGQGFMLLLVALFLWFKKKMPLGKILIPCSVSSMIFGSVFGSFFGFEHILDPMFNSLGFAEKPINIEHSSMKMNIILISVFIGVALVMVAMLISMASAVKQKRLGELLFGVNGICGFVFYSAILLGIGGQLFLGIELLSTAYILLLIILPLLLIYFREILGKLVERKSNWRPESWGAYLVESFFELFEVLLSYVTNTVSFLRVGAFVLIHAGMMTVVFQLAAMAGEGSVGYFIAVAAGNVFVMVLEALLVGIQVLRLEYYEMFSRFYQGEGRPFKPVKVIDE